MAVAVKVMLVEWEREREEQKLQEDARPEEKEEVWMWSLHADAVGPLVVTLASLCGGKYNGRSDAAATNATNTIAASTSTSSGTTVILAHGRNRFAEAAFWRHAEAAGFKAEAVPWDELDPVYRCTDVDVYRMRLVGRGDGALVE
ncbi:hypothetical protein VOLCADRAFT_91437 [Volvox carteri f. nagariensis]|uniref:Uncharacterized protein n=1 Tax=Volvox carteri f. nagariensis TaxID=3068 RepID=D8TX30_VOLCA|nr:uncharacterized protein VOLCADRAFT_91437 [Volvox carteri f. nagariensis]EFJ47937.1 hypothetical protein VOLCADRAFT_91437 [Volvox carteri f. nagariensis]|eukprot:XP_002951043.1 hypothetical protein VOLCADRAFT_91437 [Volvox carteri f. nagariensis]